MRRGNSTLTALRIIPSTWIFFHHRSTGRPVRNPGLNKNVLFELKRKKTNVYTNLIED